MPTDSNERIDTLIAEISGLRNDIKELRMLLLYQLLKTEEERSRGAFNATLFALARQAARVVADQLSEPERTTRDTAKREKRRQTKVPVNADRVTPRPLVDVNKEIAILKDEMAKSLRDAADDIEEDKAPEEEDDKE
ncbi:MAG: hypothetical protein ACXV6K_08730 [Halobacteriota archaeon]